MIPVGDDVRSLKYFRAADNLETPHVVSYKVKPAAAR